MVMIVFVYKLKLIILFSLISYMASKNMFKLSHCKTERTKVKDTSVSKTVPDYLYAHYKNQPEKEATVFTSTDGSREAPTFTDLYEKSVHFAKCLVQLGVKKSEFVAISMRTCPYWLYATFGAVMAGARPIGLSFTYTDGSDVVAMMKKLQTCSMLILDPGAEEENWNVLRKLVKHHDANGNIRSEAMPCLRYLICHDRPKDTRDVLTMTQVFTWDTPIACLPTISPDDIFALFQTSGSTGVPKAVTHTHRSFIEAAKYFSEVSIKRRDAILFNDRPFTWIGGCPVTMITGETRVTRSGYCQPPEDKVRYFIDVIKREKCSHTLILPPMLNSLMERQNELEGYWPLETIISGGQPMASTFANCVGKVCTTFHCIYGSAEFLACTAIDIERPEDFSENCAGRPFEGVEMKIVNEKEETVPVTQRGEIYVKTDSMFIGYYNDPIKTKACFDDGGWYRTDDIGFMSEDGLFFCEGRKSDMILSGGFNVLPSILEVILERCPGVARAICVPVPHKVLFQVICACVVLEDGSDVKEEDIRSYCEEIHNDKPRMFTCLPTYYMFMEKFPQTYTGKTSRKGLKKIAAEKFSGVHV